jgi:hypothetical protein
VRQSRTKEEKDISTQRPELAEFGKFIDDKLLSRHTLRLCGDENFTFAFSVVK